MWCWNNQGWAYIYGPTYGNVRGNLEKIGVESDTTFPTARTGVCAWYGKLDDKLYVFGGEGPNDYDESLSKRCHGN